MNISMVLSIRLFNYLFCNRIKICVEFILFSIHCLQPTVRLEEHKWLFERETLRCDNVNEFQQRPFILFQPTMADSTFSQYARLLEILANPLSRRLPRLICVSSTPKHNMWFILKLNLLDLSGRQQVIWRDK